MKGWYTTEDGVAEVEFNENGNVNIHLLFFNRIGDAAIENSLRLQGGELTEPICDAIVQEGEYPSGIIEEAAKLGTRGWFPYPHKLGEVD